MEQPTIFGEQFDTAILVRRRSLLSIGLKIYVLPGMILSCIGFLWLAAVMVYFFQAHMYSVIEIISFSVLIVAGFGFFFSMPATLWFERKWGIRYNWYGAGLWLILMVIGYLVTGFEWWQVIYTVIPVPYWIMLYRIQVRWEAIN